MSIKPQTSQIPLSSQGCEINQPHEFCGSDGVGDRPSEVWPKPEKMTNAPKSAEDCACKATSGFKPDPYWGGSNKAVPNYSGFSWLTEKKGWVDGIKNVNTYASATGPMVSMAGISDGNPLAIFAGLALDSAALVSEAALLLMGEKGAISSALNAINGGAIDAISPKNTAGAFTAGCVKIITEVK